MSEAPTFQNQPGQPTVRYLPGQSVPQTVNGQMPAEHYSLDEYTSDRASDEQRIDGVLEPATLVRGRLDKVDERSRMTAGEACAAAADLGEYAAVLYAIAKRLDDEAYALRMRSTDTIDTSFKLKADTEDYLDARSGVVEVTQSTLYHRDEQAVIQQEHRDRLREYGNSLGDASKLSRELNAERSELLALASEHRAVADSANSRISKSRRDREDDLYVQFQVASQLQNQTAAQSALAELQELQYVYGSVTDTLTTGDNAIASEATRNLGQIVDKQKKNDDKRRRHIEHETKLQQEMAQAAGLSRQTASDMKQSTDLLRHQLQISEVGLGIADTAVAETLDRFETNDVAQLEADTRDTLPIREEFPNLLKKMHQLLEAAGRVTPVVGVEMPDVKRALPGIIAAMEQPPIDEVVPATKPMAAPTPARIAPFRIVQNTQELSRDSRLIIKRNQVAERD